MKQQICYFILLSVLILFISSRLQKRKNSKNISKKLARVYKRNEQSPNLAREYVFPDCDGCFISKNRRGQLTYVCLCSHPLNLNFLQQIGIVLSECLTVKNAKLYAVQTSLAYPNNLDNCNFDRLSRPTKIKARCGYKKCDSQKLLNDKNCQIEASIQVDQVLKVEKTNNDIYLKCATNMYSGDTRLEKNDVLPAPRMPGNADQNKIPLQSAGTNNPMTTTRPPLVMTMAAQLIHARGGRLASK
jgi:hypothetical protein